MNKTLYKYEGAVYNSHTIYKTVTEYVYAFTKMQAMRILSKRISKANGRQLTLKLSNLTEETK